MSEELAQRAVACKHWRWMPGMLDQTGFRLVSREPEWSPDVWQLGGRACLGTLTGIPDLPDLDDQATVGCLLALVREAHGGKPVFLSPDTREHGNEILEWEVCVFVGWFASETLAFGPTEAAALVAALEAAP